MKLRVAVLVVSDRVSRGEMVDRSGPAARGALEPMADVVQASVVADEVEEIRSRLEAWCGANIDVVLTLGGTGLSPRDVTPEATRRVIDREVPGLVMALIANGLQRTPRAALSRAIAGQKGRTLIINLPGSPQAVQQSIQFLLPILPHAVEMMQGKGHERDRPAHAPHASA